MDKPDPELFRFESSDFLCMNRARFKAISEHNFKLLKNTEAYTFIGVLYEKFHGETRKLMLQNEINEVELVFPTGF